MANANSDGSGPSRPAPLSQPDRAECIRLQAERVVGAYNALRAAPSSADFTNDAFPVGQFAALVNEVQRLGGCLESAEQPSNAAAAPTDDDEPEGDLFLECMREGDDDERHAKYALVRNPGRDEYSLIDIAYSVRAIGNAITQAEGDVNATAGLAGALTVIGAQLVHVFSDVEYSDRETLGAMLREGGAS